MRVPSTMLYHGVKGVFPRPFPIVNGAYQNEGPYAYAGSRYVNVTRGLPRHVGQSKTIIHEFFYPCL